MSEGQTRSEAQGAQAAALFYFKQGAADCRRLLPTKHRPTRTRKGLTYTLFEGRKLELLSKGDSKLGDGNPWMPTIRVSGGEAAFYSIDVRK